MVPLILAPPPPLVFHQPASLLSPPLSRSLQAARDNQHTQQETSSTPLPQTPFPNSASALEDLFSARLVEYRAGWRPPPSPPASPIQQAMLQTLAFSLSDQQATPLQALSSSLPPAPPITASPPQQQSQEAEQLSHSPTRSQDFSESEAEAQDSLQSLTALSSSAVAVHLRSPLSPQPLALAASSPSHTPPADLHGLLRLLSMSPSLTPQVLFLKPAAAQTKQHTQQETSFTPLPQTPFPNSASALEDLFSARLVEYRAGWRPQPSPLSPEH